MNTLKHTISTNISIKFLLFVSFIEGAAVMIIELLGAKIIAPFYGTSMYVWASVLGVTLIALAGGYYGGGWVSHRYKNKSPLFIILALGALFTILSPKIAPNIMMATTELGVRGGSFVSVLIYLLPSVVCMGMVSPIIIQQINQSSDNAGQSAGTVYAISTLGGILATFLAGFILIPQMGIRTTATLTGSVLLALSIAGMFYYKQGRSVIFVGVLCFLFIPYSYSKGQKSDPSVSVRFQSSGILGEWTVVDQVVVVQQDGVPLSTRQLLLNGVDQTYTEVGNEPVSMWMYPHKLAALAGIKPEKSNALLLGMGGGSIAHNLINLGFKLDIVELDDRVPYIAETYFGFNPKTANLVIDDARHFVRNSKSKYDIVVLDLVNGEVQPSHIFTQEGLKELRKVLNDDALVIINFQGRFDMENPKLSLGPRSVFKTFESVGFKMFVGKRDALDEKNASADLLMYGTPSSLDFKAAFQDSLRYNKIFTFEKFLAEDFKPIAGFNLVDAQIMTDDLPNLELLNAPTILEWRKNKIKYTVDGLLKKGLPIYH